MAMKKYRLYIDESGSHEYATSDSIKKRYLGLVGVIVDSEEYENKIQPRIIELKKIFSSDPDNLVVLHRDEIVNKQGPFTILEDKEINEKFNEKLLSLFQETSFVLCGVVLDKKSHLEKYKTSALHPYHYCLNVILERYVFYLGEVDGIGDVMSEARGKNEDRALKNAYNSFYHNGTWYCDSNCVQRRLTSNDIKLRDKKNTTEGLELADLLVLAIKFFILQEFGKLPTLSDNFTKIIIENIKSKFRKNPSSQRIKGFGIKLIA